MGSMSHQSSERHIGACGGPRQHAPQYIAVNDGSYIAVAA